MTTRFLAAAALAAAVAPAASAADVTVMSFNIWGGGANEGKTVDETVAAIRRADADIIGIQETRVEGDDCTAESCPPHGESVASTIALQLGLHYYEQTAESPALWSNAILSRWPIGPAGPMDLCVPIDVDGTAILACNLHLDDAPYQPYQLLGIEYGPYPFLSTPEEAIASAEETRGPALEMLIADLETLLAGTDGSMPVMIFGDFNEPSHLDWTEEAAAAGLHPMAVAWPVSSRFADWGFIDTFRAVHPDPVALPGFTWTPTSEPSDPEDHHDRIDFIYVRGVELLDSMIVGEKSPEAGLVSEPWPSDHRAVMARIRF